MRSALGSTRLPSRCTSSESFEASSGRPLRSTPALCGGLPHTRFSVVAKSLKNRSFAFPKTHFSTAEACALKEEFRTKESFWFLHRLFELTALSLLRGFTGIGSEMDLLNFKCCSAQLLQLPELEKAVFLLVLVCLLKDRLARFCYFRSKNLYWPAYNNPFR